MTKLGFLPKNPCSRTQRSSFPGTGMIANPAYSAWETGSEATIKAIVKWLFEPCTEHPFHDKNGQFCGTGDPCFDRLFYKHHYLCPECMRQLKEWSEK